MPKFSQRTTLWVIAGVLLVVAVVLVLTSPAAVTEREAERRRVSQDVSPAQGMASITVDVYVVESSQERARADVTGVLEPVRRVVVAAEVPGQVIAVEAMEHTPIATGDVLIRLDPALPEAAAKRAGAALLRAQAQDRLAQSELRRQRNLSKQGVTSSADLDRAESQARSSRAQVAEARAALNDAETRLAKTEIRAPFAGDISKLDLDPGAYVQPGQAVAEIADLSEIEIEVGVSDHEILGLGVGDPVELRVQALPNEPFAGRIAALGRNADLATRKYPVQVIVSNLDRRLLSGMLGTLRFELGDERSVVIVPRQSVRKEFDLAYLFVLEPAGEGRAVTRRRRVSTRPLPFRPEVLEVTAGLEPGEQIATTGVRELRDGQLVRIRSGDSGSGFAPRGS